MQSTLKSGMGVCIHDCVPTRHGWRCLAEQGGRENHDLSLVFYFNGLLSYLEEISVSICLHLEASWSPIPIYDYFHVALRACQGRGWL